MSGPFNTFARPTYELPGSSPPAREDVAERAVHLMAVVDWPAPNTVVVACGRPRLDDPNVTSTPHLNLVTCKRCLRSGKLRLKQNGGTK